MLKFAGTGTRAPGGRGTGGRSVEGEDVLEADGQARAVGDPARSPVRTPGVNEARSIESWRMVRVSPSPPSSDLLVGDQALDPQPVDPDAVDVRAAGAVQRGARWRRASGRSRPATRPRRRAAAVRRGRAAGGVGLVRVVQLDDLDGVEEAAPPRRRSASSARRRSRSSGRSSTPTLGPALEPGRSWSSRSSSKPVVPTTAWMPCSMQKREVGHHDVGVGEVDDRLRAGRHQVGQVVVDVDARHQLEVVGRLDGGADLAADLALSAEHADLPHLSHATTL